MPVNRRNVDRAITEKLDEWGDELNVRFTPPTDEFRWTCILAIEERRAGRISATECNERIAKAYVDSIPKANVLGTRISDIPNDSGDVGLQLDFGF